MKVSFSFEMGYTVPMSITLGSSSSSCHYSEVKFVSMDRKLVGFPLFNQLSCDNHPFFKGLHPLGLGVNAFYNSVLSFNTDIFKNFQMSQNSLKEALLGELLGATSNHEGKPISEVTPEELSEVAEVAEEVKRMRIRIEWFDRVIGRILEVKELEEKAATIRERMEVLKKQLDALAEELK